MTAARSVLAILVGFAVAVVLLVVLGGMLERAAQRGPVGSGAEHFLAVLAVGALSGAVGGYLSAALAVAQRQWHAAVVAALLLGMGMAAALRGAAFDTPRWFPLLFALAVPAGVMAGARVHAPRP